MMSAKLSDFLTPSPLSTFGTDLWFKIHATSLTTSAFPCPPSPSDVDIISGRSHRGLTMQLCLHKTYFILLYAVGVIKNIMIKAAVLLLTFT